MHACPGARLLVRALAAAYRSAGDLEQQVAHLRDTLAATSADEAAARAERRDKDTPRLAREVGQVRTRLRCSSLRDSSCVAALGSGTRVWSGACNCKVVLGFGQAGAVKGGRNQHAGAEARTSSGLAQGDTYAMRPSFSVESSLWFPAGA